MLDTTRRLIQELSAASWFQRLTGAARARRIAILQRLGESGDSDAIATLLDYALSSDVHEASIARASVARLLASVEVRKLGNLDERLREQAPYGLRAWYALRVADVAKLGHPALLALATSHPNGFVREDALRTIALGGDGSEIPLLLVRLNDWVLPIRTLAEASLRERLSPRYARGWARALPLLMRLREQKRGMHHVMIRDVRRLLQQRECRPALAEALKDGDLHVRREAFRLAKGAEGLSLPELALRALEDRDALVRLFALREIAKETPEEHREAIAVALRDPYFAVRREALALLERLDGIHARPDVEGALLDRHVAVREWAQRALERVAPDLDPRERYREELATARGNRLAAAVLGLSEVGRRTDAATLRPYFRNDRASVRRAVLRALYRMETPAPVDVLLEGLQDPRGSVSTVARSLLARETLPPMAPGLEELVRDRTQPTAVRRNALWLLSRLDKWASAAALVAATAEPPLAALAETLLFRWIARYNRSFTTLSAERERALRDALASAGASVPAEIGRTLRSILDSAHR